MSGWKKTALWALAAVAGLYGAVAADVVLRARTAYLEGEKYMYWHDHPESKKAYFEGRFAEKEKSLQAERAAGRMSGDEYEERLELARFERDQAVSESSAKYAYVWFQTAAELFTPPESRWIAKARLRLPVAKKLWQDELRAKGLPFEDYMFE